MTSWMFLLVSWHQQMWRMSMLLLYNVQSDAYWARLHLLWIFKVLFIQTHLFRLTVFTSTLYQHFLILAFIWILKVSVLGDLHAVWPLWRQLQYIYWVLEGTIEEDQQLGLLFYAECKLCMCSWTMTSWTDDGHRIASSFPIKVMFFYQFH